MFVNFNELASASKVWVYQSNRELTTNESEEILSKVETFITKFRRHGNALKGACLIKYNYFVIIGIDESFSEISGCSIDATINLIKNFEKQYEIDLTNRLNVSFKDNENINVVQLKRFQEFAKQGKILPTTIVFNNLVATKSEFETNWEIPAEKSWHKRFLQPIS